jgi:aspartyl-tRNA(Asn)/glutamyl-tRNA(Gln) amidotransferase subunit B
MEAGRNYEPVIGVEIHAQLATRSKMFCGCAVGFGAAPNSVTCPVCLGLPGAMPVVNFEAVSMAIRLALATGCEINPVSTWDRKNYFYPDLPKGYQITQQHRPLATRGALAIDTGRGPLRVGIDRVHLEEDAGKCIHPAEGGPSLVDFNRCGVPLVEIVSGPDLRSPEEAVAFLREVRAVLVSLGISGGSMERGELRCDGNLSLRPRGQKTLGTRTEVKNVNSFRFLKKALCAEMERQARRLGRGEPVIQETRLFDPERGTTRSMRSKEEDGDYRYFPEPDLPPLVVEGAWIERERGRLPVLPRERLEHLVSRHGLSRPTARILVARPDLADFFEAAVRIHPAPDRIANWMVNELPGEWKHEEAGPLPFAPEALASLVALIDEGSLSVPAGRDVLVEMARGGKPPAEIVKEKSLGLLSPQEMEAAVQQVLDAHPGEVDKYRRGKKALLSFLVGQVMRTARGRADPVRVSELIRKRLG